ncbi:MAG TPA: hypothetical protein VFQ61_33310 [Polyangiaceae bacterium]|nr:hypothetical protein [Polyangiaceae bacterium]
MSDWLFMLGEPLGQREREQVREYLTGLGLEQELSFETVKDFAAAARIIAHPDWDRRWWDAEQRERERLRNQLVSTPGSGQRLRALSDFVQDSISEHHGTAAAQATRLGCADAGLIRAAAGALGEALYLGKLAQLAGAPASHPFLLKQALFEGGHWPLIVLAGHFYVF